MARALRPLVPFVPLMALALLGPASAGAQPAGTVTTAAHITLATRWLDPAETDAEITPFMILYALHDALVKPMPGAPSRRAWPSRGPCRRTGGPGSSCSARGRASTTATRSPPTT